MGAVRTRYELRVGTVISEAALASFRVPMRPTAVPRNTVYRFVVPDDRDLTEVLHRLTELDVQVLEIRRCPEPRRRAPGSASGETSCRESATPPTDAEGVVVPFPAGSGRRLGSAR